MPAQGSVTNTTGYVNYVYNISARGTSQVASQLMGLSGIAGNILGQLAFQTSSYLTSTEGSLLSLGVVASASLSKATQFAMKFNQEMETVHAISGKTVTTLADDAMRMSNKFGVALGDMTTGLEALARAGVSTGNMTAILEQAMGLSKLEGLTLEQSINDLISTTNLLDTKGLDLESPEYAEAVKYQTQKITATSEAAPINATNIIHTLEHVGGYASSTNIDQDDLYAVIAQLGSKGTKGDMAGTSLRAFISAGQKDTAQRALARIGLSVEDLWKDDETIMSISDMKDVLDEAMESRGYTQQEKLEFYSDFAGYKQANQIMKIDTTSVREFKDKIDRSWDTSKKMETVLNTAQTNLQSLMQTGINFLTKVGEPFLPIVSTISKVLKTMIDVVGAIPFSNWVVAGGLALVSIKSISTILNKILPSILAHKESALSIKNFWADTKDSVQETFDIISHHNDYQMLRKKQINNEVNRVTDNDKIFSWQKRGFNVKNLDDVLVLEARIGQKNSTNMYRQDKKERLNKLYFDPKWFGQQQEKRNERQSDNDTLTVIKDIREILKNAFGDGTGANVDTSLTKKIDDLSDSISALTHVHQGSLEAVNSTIENTYALLNGTKQSTQGSSMSFDLPGIKEMINLLKESNTIVSDIDLSSLDSIDENISHILDTVITLTNFIAKDNKVSRNKFVGRQEKAQALTGFGSLVDQGNAYAQRVETTARTKRVEKEEAERILNQGLFDIDKFLEKNLDTLVKAWTKKGIDRRKFDKLDFDFGFDTSTFEGQEMERIVRGMLLDAFKSYNIGMRTRLTGLSKEALIGDIRNRVRLRQNSYNGTGTRNTAVGNYVETILPNQIQHDNPQGFYAPGKGKEKKTTEVIYVDDQGNVLKDEYGNVRKERVPVMEAHQGIGYEYEPKSGARVTSEKDVKVKGVTYRRQKISDKPGRWVDLSRPGEIPSLAYGLSNTIKENADTGKQLTQADILKQRKNLFKDSFRIATTIDDRKNREVENFTGDEINTLFSYMSDELSVDFVKLLAGKSYEDMKPSEVKDFKKRLKDEFDGTLKLGKNGTLKLGSGISNQQRGMNTLLQAIESDSSQQHIKNNLTNFVTKQKYGVWTELENRTQKASMNKLSIPQLKAIAMLGGTDLTDAYEKNKDGSLGQLDKSKAIELLGDSYGQVPFELMEDFRANPSAIEQYSKSDTYAYARKLETLYSAPFARVFTKGGLTGKLKKEFEDTFNISGDSDWEKMANFIMTASGETLAEADKWVAQKLKLPSFDNTVKYSPEGYLKYNSHSMLDRNADPNYVTAVANVGQDGIHGIRGNFASIVSMIMELAFNEASDEIKKANTTTPNWLSDKRWQMLNDPVNPNRKYKNLEETKNYGLRKKNMDAHRFDTRYTGTIGDENVDNEKLVVSEPKSYNPQTFMTMGRRAVGLILDNIDSFAFSDNYVQYLSSAFNSGQIDEDILMDIIGDTNVVDTIFDIVTAGGDWGALDDLLLLDNMWDFGADFKKKVNESKRIRREQHYNNIDPFEKERKKMSNWTPEQRKASLVLGADTDVQAGRAEYEPMPTLVDDNGEQVIASGIFMRRPTHGRDFHRNVKTEPFVTNAVLNDEQKGEIQTEFDKQRKKAEEDAEINTEFRDVWNIRNVVLDKFYALKASGNYNPNASREFDHSIKVLEEGPIEDVFNTLKNMSVTLPYDIRDYGVFDKDDDDADDFYHYIMDIGHFTKNKKNITDFNISGQRHYKETEGVRLLKARNEELQKTLKEGSPEEQLEAKKELSINHGKIKIWEGYTKDSDLFKIPEGLLPKMRRNIIDEIQKEFFDFQKLKGATNLLSSEPPKNFTSSTAMIQFGKLKGIPNLLSSEPSQNTQGIQAMINLVNNTMGMNLKYDDVVSAATEIKEQYEEEFKEINNQKFVAATQGIRTGQGANTLEAQRLDQKLTQMRSAIASESPLKAIGLMLYDAEQTQQGAEILVDELIDRLQTSVDTMEKEIADQGWRENNTNKIKSTKSRMRTNKRYIRMLKKNKNNVYDILATLQLEANELQRGMEKLERIERTNPATGEKEKVINPKKLRKKSFSRNFLDGIEGDWKLKQMDLDDINSLIEQISTMANNGSNSAYVDRHVQKAIQNKVTPQVKYDEVATVFLRNDQGVYSDVISNTLQMNRNKKAWGYQLNDLRTNLAFDYGLSEYDIHAPALTEQQQQRVDEIFNQQDFIGIQEYIAEHGQKAFKDMRKEMLIKFAYQDRHTGEWREYAPFMKTMDEVKELYGDFDDNTMELLNNGMVLDFNTLHRTHAEIAEQVQLEDVLKSIDNMEEAKKVMYKQVAVAADLNDIKLVIDESGEVIQKIGQQLEEGEQELESAKDALQRVPSYLRDQILTGNDNFGEARNASTDTINDVVNNGQMQNIIEQHQREIPDLYEELRKRGDFKEMLEGIYQVNKELYQQLINYGLSREEDVKEGLAKYDLLKEMSKKNPIKAADFILTKHDVLADAMTFKEEQLISDKEMAKHSEVLRGGTSDANSMAELVKEAERNATMYGGDVLNPEEYSGTTEENIDVFDFENLDTSFVGDYVDKKFEHLEQTTITPDNYIIGQQIGANVYQDDRVSEYENKTQEYIDMIKRNLESQGYASKQIDQIIDEIQSLFEGEDNVTNKKEDVRQTKRSLRKLIFKREALIMNLLGEEGANEFFDFKTREATPDDIDAFNAQKSKYLNKEDLAFINNRFKISSDAGTAKDRSRDVKRQLKRRGLWNEAISSLRRNKYGDIYEMNLDQLLAHINAIDKKINDTFDFNDVDIKKLGAESDMINTMKDINGGFNHLDELERNKTKAQDMKNNVLDEQAYKDAMIANMPEAFDQEEVINAVNRQKERELEKERKHKEAEEAAYRASLSGVQYTDAYVDAPHNKDIRYYQGNPLYQSINEFFDQKSYDEAKKQFYENPNQRTFARYARMKEQNPYDNIDNVIFDEFAKQEYESVKTAFYMNPNLETFDALNAMGSSNVYGKYFQDDVHYNDTYLRIADEAFQRDLQAEQERQRIQNIKDYYKDNITMKEANGIQYAESNWLNEMWQGAQYSASQGVGAPNEFDQQVATIKNKWNRFLIDTFAQFSDVDLAKNEDIVHYTDKFNQTLDSTIDTLGNWAYVLDDLGTIFPPLKVGLLGLQTVIEGITKVKDINTRLQDFMNMGIDLKNGAVIENFLPGGGELTDSTLLGQFIIGSSDILAKAMEKVGSLLMRFGPYLAAIGASLFVVKQGLDWSYQSHQKWLKSLEEEQKEKRSKSTSLQKTAEDAKNLAEKNRAPRQQDARNRNYILAQQRLDNANMTRAFGAMQLSRARNDTLWGEYGISAGLNKLQGKYESTVDEYDGTSKETRRIKEATLANPFATGSMRQVAAYYDANQLAFSQMDEYKDELGALYDTETNIMKKVGPGVDARGTPQFEKALDKFVEATGITRDHAKQYLDYMQTEHNVDKATQAMQAQADTISAQTEMKIQAIAFGGNPADVLGLNGIEAQQNAMVKAQADMIKMELSGQLWWKAVWATITAPVKLIISPIFAIANLLGAIWAFMTGNWGEAWDKAGKATSSFNVFGEAATYWGAWAETESTDFNSIGNNAIDDRNRRNYGNAVASASGVGYKNTPDVPIGKYGFGGQIFIKDKPGLPPGGSFHHDRDGSTIPNILGGIGAMLGTIISILTTGLLLGGAAAGIKKIFDAKGISIDAKSLGEGLKGLKDKIFNFDVGNLKDLTLKDIFSKGTKAVSEFSLGDAWNSISGFGGKAKETIKKKAMWARFSLENLIYGQPAESSGAIIRDGKVIPTGERSGGLKDKYQSFIEQHKDNAWVQYGNKKLQSAKQLPDKLKEQYVNPWKDYISEQASSYVNGLIPLDENYDDFNKKKRSYLNKDDLDFIAEQYGITSDEKTAKLRSRDVRKQLDEKGLWGEASEELYRRQQKEVAGGPLGIVKAHINEKYVDPWKEHIQKRADQGKEKGKEWLASQKDKFMDKYGERFGLTVGDTSIFDALQDPEKMESFVKDKFANAKDGTLLAQVRDKVTTGKELLQDPEKLHGILKDKYGDKIQRGKELLQDPEAMEGFVKDKFTNLKDKVTNFFDIDDEDDGKSFFRKHFDNIKEKVMSFFGKKGEADETGEDTPLLNTSEIIQNTTMEDAKEAMGKLFGPKALPGDDEDVIDLGPDEWSTVSSKIEGSFTDRIRDYIDGLQGTMGDIFENMKNNIQGFDIGEKFQSVKDRLSSLFGDDENGEPGFFKKHFNKFKDKIFSFFGKKSESEPEDGGMIDSLPGTAQKLLGMSDDDGVIDLGPDEWSTVSSSIETSFADRIRNKFRRKKKDVEPESEPEDVGEGEYKYNSMFDFFRDLRREKKESQAMEAEAAAANAKKMAKEKHMYQGEYYEGFDLGDNLNIDEGVSRTFHKAKDKISEKFGLSDKIPLLGGGGSIVPHRKPAGSVEGSSPSLLGGDNGIIDLMPGEWSTVSTSSEGGSLFDRVRSGFSDKRNSASSAFGNAKEFMSNKLGGGKLGGGKVGGALKGLGGKLGKTGIGKAGSKVLSKVGGKLGGKLLAKGGSQVLSKVLAGGLAATGIGAPLAAIMASPIGGFLVEGAMNLGGAVLGGAGKLLGGAKKALGFGGYNNTGKGGGGFLGGLLKASPLGMLGGALGLGGLVAGGLGAMFGGILGLGKGAKGGANLMKAASPLSMINVLKGAKDIAEKHLSIGEKQKKAMDKVVENTSNHNNNNASGGSITIQNININTDDDPEAIKAMFLDLIVELQEQVNPRLVSRTTGSSNASTNDSSTQTDTEQSQQQQSGTSTGGQGLNGH